MSEFDKILTKRPRGLVPGSIEWHRELMGPKLLKRLHAEIESQVVGEMTPTGARLLIKGLEMIYPNLTAVHHTIENTYANLTIAELEAKLKEIASDIKQEALQPVDVKFIEHDKT